MDARECFDQINHRQSIGLLAEPAPNTESLMWAIRAAMTAPDHKRLKPWRFLTISGAARHQLGVLLAEAAARHGELTEPRRQKLLQSPLRAPLILVAILCYQPNDKVPRHEQWLSLGAAIQNLLLMLDAQGYGSIWRTGDPATDPDVMAGLGLAADEAIGGFIYIGTPVKRPEPRQQAELDPVRVHAWPESV